MADEVDRPRAREAGFTLVELTVALGLFAAFLALFATAAVGFAGATADARADASSSSSIGVAAQRVQRSIRYADSVNYPGLVGTTVYTEWHTTAQSSPTGVATCTQLRYNSATGVIAMRTWADTASAATGPWATILSGVTGAATTSTPFAVSPAAGGVSNYQGLTLTLNVGVTSSGSTSSTVTFYARNSSVNSRSNAIATSGQSAVPICTGTGYRP